MLRAVGSFQASMLRWSDVLQGGAFQEIQGDQQSDGQTCSYSRQCAATHPPTESKKLVSIDIVLGSLYSGVAAIEVSRTFIVWGFDLTVSHRLSEYLRP